MFHRKHSALCKFLSVTHCHASEPPSNVRAAVLAAVPTAAFSLLGVTLFYVSISFPL